MTDAARLAEARRILQEWLDRQGHDRCWYYPDVFTRLAGCLDVTATVGPGLPPRAEFEAGCRRYQDEEFGCPGPQDPGRGPAP
jgi:hypothetical protein